MSEPILTAIVLLVTAIGVLAIFVLAIVLVDYLDRYLDR